uniref:Uncharacterized protein n=1 Tax=Ascaris lumbricoides TaxID=6252 RepID=A0A0M3HSG0_ASCLU
MYSFRDIAFAVIIVSTRVRLSQPLDPFEHELSTIFIPFTTLQSS